MNEQIEILLKSAELWSKITGVSFNQNSFTNVSQITANISNSRIKNALELDPNGFLPTMVLFSEFNKYCQENHFRLYDVLHKPELIEKINNAKEMLSLMDNPIVKLRLIQEQTRFHNILRKIKNDMLLTGPKSESEDEAEVTSNELFIDLMYEAKLAGKNLRIDQFSKGQKSEKNPVIAKTIFKSHSVHNFITSLASNPECESMIAMCLIQDEYDPLFSYFVIGIRNGQKIYIASDKPNSPNPLYKTRTRRPGRHQEERMDKFWFPYYLMDFDLDARGDLMGVKNEEESKTLNEKAIPLCSLTSMHHENLLWFIMLYHSLVDKFFINDYENEELSYTGNMINIKKEHNELSKNLVVQNAGSVMIQIPNTKELPIVIKEKGNFSWELLNNTQLYELNKIDVNADILVPIENSLKEVKISADGLTATGYSFDRNIFGTEKELTEDLLFIARYNESQLIEAKIESNFKSKKEEIMKWYNTKINENKEAFFKAIVEGEFIALDEKNTRHFDYEEEYSNILKFCEKNDDYNTRWFNFIIKYDNSTWHNSDSCAYNGAKSFYKAVFMIGTAGAIAKATGVDIDELPEEIKGYKHHGRYSGNSILDRVDPMEDIQNPYNKINFWVELYLSKSGYKALKKKYVKGDK